LVLPLLERTPDPAPVRDFVNGFDGGRLPTGSFGPVALLVVPFALSLGQVQVSWEVVPLAVPPAVLVVEPAPVRDFVNGFDGAETPSGRLGPVELSAAGPGNVVPAPVPVPVVVPVPVLVVLPCGRPVVPIVPCGEAVVPVDVPVTPVELPVVEPVVPNVVP